MSRSALRSITIYCSALLLTLLLVRHLRGLGGPYFEIPETIYDHVPGAPHLSRQAIVIFRELHGMTGQGEYVFPAVNSFRRPMSNNTLNAALRRLRLAGADGAGRREEESGSALAVGRGGRI